MWNTSILFFSSSNYSNFVKVIADHIGGTLKLWDSCLKLGQGWWKMEHCAPDHINGQWEGYFSTPARFWPESDGGIGQVKKSITLKWKVLLQPVC